MPTRIEHPVRPGLRMECADDGRLLLVQGGRPVLFARQRASHHGVHYARTGRYASPLGPLRAADDRGLAALTEGARPQLLLLSRAADAAAVAMRSAWPLREYEERMAALAPGPLTGARVSAAGRRLAAALTAAERAAEITRAWPLPGGVPAWERAAAAHVPGWAPPRTP